VTGFGPPYVRSWPVGRKMHLEHGTRHRPDLQILGRYNFTQYRFIAGLDVN
jgi:hypothetical protein